MSVIEWIQKNGARWAGKEGDFWSVEIRWQNGIPQELRNVYGAILTPHKEILLCHNLDEMYETWKSLKKEDV